MQKEIPILFSTMMVQAILAGRKTKTRRTVKMTKDDINEATWGYTCFTPDRHISFRAKHASGEYGESFIKCPYGKKGDILWVRESWQPLIAGSEIEPGFKEYIRFKADGAEVIFNHNKDDYRERPSIHMPKAAARIWLEVENITVERLHDISGDDVLAEGIDNGKSNKTMGKRWENMQQMAFEELWCKINGAESWTANPWVWVISFKVLSTTGKP